MKARMPEGMSDRIITVLLVATLVLTAVTAASNVGHGYSLALYAGQSERLATLAAVVPDVLIAVATTVLAFRHRSPWAWAALASAIAFVGWAAVVTSLPGFCTPAGDCEGIAADAVTRVLVAVWPLLAAVLVAGVMASLLHDQAPAAVAVEEAKVKAKKTPRKRVIAPLPDEGDGKGDPPPPPPKIPPVGTAADRVLIALQAGPMTRAQLAEKVGAKEDTVKGILTRLKGDGAIEQDPTRAQHWRLHVALKAVAR